MKSTNLLLLVVFSALYCTFATAQRKPDYSSPISIKIQSSQSQPTVGTGLGVTAEIKNVSDSSVIIDGRTITLMFPPELEGPFKGTLAYEGFLPTEWAMGEKGLPTSIKLLPGDTYKIFWSPGRNYDSNETTSITSSIRKTIKSEMKFLFFQPGEYTLTVDAKYWFHPNEDYHTTAESTTLHFAAPQSVILVGAALGGLVAFYLFPHARRRMIIRKKNREITIMSVVQRVAKEIGGIVGSILLSAIVTILLSRISETQFFIKVTVTDFWGAIAIGFVANYLGARWLDKLLLQSSSSSVQDGSSTTSAEAAAIPGEKVPSKGERHRIRKGK